MEIQGIIVPILTPMRPDGSLHSDALSDEIERLIAAKVHGIFPLGTNGEGYILSMEEKEEVLRETVRCVAGRLPVYAGTGCISTADTVRFSRRAQDFGADALSVITPWFAAASQEELQRHFETVAKSVSLPLILYNIPARTGNALAPATVEKLANMPNIVGVKDSSGNFDNMLQYIERTRHRPDFSVLSGNDSLILWTLLAGGKGGVAGCANVFPRNMVEIYEAFRRGDLNAARQAQDAIRPFRNCFRFGNPNTIVKTAVGMLGHNVGPCRPPFDGLSQEGRDAVRAVLQDLTGKGVN